MAIKEAKITFISLLEYKAKKNEFQNLPNDLQDFLNRHENCVSNITDELNPDEKYEITISFKLIKPAATGSGK